ncbi:MAG: EthD domain-containing protein [Nostoc sp. EfeVER01]|uniref:EthD domain-containing protein n=1 Tax=unclassified Nostoc TaxID=2593658 RepID=UPI002AD317DF|nr:MULTISPECIES: EthD domain-containing protein [unclassified Nostoc]MDZ7943667.1 EthD domain-containing protein [Nostoc sp. EfeVER01]MDZ7991674.1 EthD domain-containing protein [Nostoc sp. EspVER01]
MIHRMIFVPPKPGITEEEFQRHWKENHVPLAIKMPHLKPYLISFKIPFLEDQGNDLFSGGVSESWFENENAMLEAIQSKEYIQGARPDEPNFVAFWQIFVLDTKDYVLKEKDALKQESSLVKMFILLKRKPGMSLAEFRQYWLETHSSLVLNLPGIRRYVQCHVQDYFYAIGESSFDGVEQIWFDDTQAIEKMMKSPEYQDKVMPDMENFVEPKYIFRFVTNEYWAAGEPVY